MREPSRGRLGRACAATTAALLGAGVLIGANNLPASAAAGCQASYTVSSSWSTGFTAAVSVTNLGSALSSWSVTWTFPGNQQITQIWNATDTQSGENVTAVNVSYNGSVATGASLSFGFNGSYSGTNAVPSQLSLNGVACTGTVTSSSASPSPTPTPTSASASASASATPSASASPTSSASSPPPPNQGTWQAAPVNPATGGAATFLWLMTDGSILSNGANLNQWVELVPDAKGSYADGTWQTLATSPYGLGAAQEHILPDGRFYQAGGEYVYEYPSGSSANDHNAVQLYNPATNTWSLGQEGLYGNLYDTGSASLANGSIVASDEQQAQTQIFNPSTNSWTAAGSRPASAGEDGWVTLPDDSVVAMSSGGQYRYNASTKTWITLPAAPSGFQNGSVDPAMTTLMYNGKILVMGGNSSAVYTPGSTPSSPGSWAQGPGMLAGSYVDDSYTVPEVNGDVLVDTIKCSWITNACGSASGPMLQEYNPTTNSFTQIPEPPDGSGQAVNFINLPNGQVLAAAGDQDWIYTPVGTPQNSWRPTVSSVTANGNGSYLLTGTQLSGLVSVGEDDYQDPQNFPIVYLKNSSGNVYYATTSNFSTMAPSTPGEVETTDFTLPSSLPHGTYSLYVSANGVSSAAAYAFTY
jgi:hypothetical protein